MVAALAVLSCLVPHQAAAQGSTTSTTSETRSATSTVIVGGGGALSSQLQQALSSANGSAVAAALSQVLGPTSVSQTSTSSFSTYVTFAIATPITIPVNSGPGTINCTGPPAGATWPVPNCDFTGYQAFVVAPGTLNVNTNEHFDFTRSITITAGSAGLNWLIGDAHTAFQTTMIDGAFTFVGTLLGRTTETSVAGGASAPAMMAYASDTTSSTAAALLAVMPGVPVSADIGDGWRAWLRGSYARAGFDGTASNLGFSNRTLALDGGVERADGRFLYGIAAGFGRSDVTQYTSGDRGEIDTFRIGVHGGYRDGPWSLTGALAAGFNSISATRLALLPTPATASYGAISISAGVEAAYRLDVGDVRIEPLAGLVYTMLRVNSFRESGTTFLDLSGDRATIDALKGYIGVRVSTTFDVSTVAVTPELRGRLLYDFLNDPRGFTARFTGDPAATPVPVTGIQPGRLAGMVGVGVTARVAPNWHAFAGYDAELRHNSVTHLVSGGVKLSW